MTSASDDTAAIDALIARYEGDAEVVNILANSLVQLMETPSMKKLYHSLRWRIKEPSHLRDKLLRMLIKRRARGKTFDVTPENLYAKVNDLVGVRLLYLHTSQFPSINEGLQRTFVEYSYRVVEGPEARVWDNEYREIFGAMGVDVTDSPRMYTSVHYVIEDNSRSKRTAEIQVRTLAEELWGEVDHTINYPEPSPFLACREQIKVLARVTSSATRLVDSIFSTHADGADATSG